MPTQPAMLFAVQDVTLEEVQLNVIVEPGTTFNGPSEPFIFRSTLGAPAAAAVTVTGTVVSQ